MSDEERTSLDRTRDRQTKVERLIKGYELEGIAEELAQHWRGPGDDRHSLRELATYFNRTLTRTAMVDAGLNPLDGEAENNYTLLTESETTSGAQRKAERRLERTGIDVDQLRRDFVSHQAIHTYLTNVRGLDFNAESGAGNVEAKIETIQRLVGRTRSVSETVVDGLVRAGTVNICEYDITANVQITCRGCNSQYDLAQFLRRGSCECKK